MDLGQTVNLDSDGIFGTPSAQGTAGSILIDNSLQGNPHAILSDSDGNAIFFNTESGMDIGQSKITPIDEYQIWFDNYQDTGTIIAENVSNPGTVTFDGSTTTQTISYNDSGKWVAGALTADNIELDTDVTNAAFVEVLVVFNTILTTGAVTYLLSQLINKFPDSLKPTSIKASAGSANLEIRFSESADDGLGFVALDQYEIVTNEALYSASHDSSSPIAGDEWQLSEPRVSVFY